MFASCVPAKYSWLSMVYADSHVFLTSTETKL